MKTATQRQSRRRAPEPSSILKRKIGRPSNYQEDFARQAYVACAELGATSAGLAKLFDVSLSSIEKWLRDITKFKSSVKDGRDVFNSDEVERSLLQRAMGCEYEEVSLRTFTKNRKSIGEDGKTIWEEVPVEERTVTIKRIQPDTVAIMFWLQNRDPERWKNVRRVEAGGSIDVKHDHKHKVEFDFSEVEDDELKTLRDILARTSVAEPSGHRPGDGQASSPGLRVPLLGRN